MKSVPSQDARLSGFETDDAGQRAGREIFGLEFELFSSIVGAIYECALDPTGWPPTLDRIREAVGGAAAWIAVHFPGQVRSIYEIEVGTDVEQQQRLRTQYVAASPFIGAVHYVKAGDILSAGDVIDYQEFVAGRFYREWAAPQGWPDFIMGVLTRESDRFSWLGICMPEPVNAKHKARLGAFLPHVERALRISDLLESRSAEAADLAAAVASLDTGMILVDAGLGVRGINPAAERLLRESAGLSADAGKLRFPRSETGAQLTAAIEACVESRIDSAGATILFDDDRGELGLLIHVLPLPRPRAAAGEEAVAALFLTNPAAAHRPPTQAFIERYSLTPSETRVLLAIMEGRSPRAIAAAQGVAIATVRTHLRRLYEKTGTGGQTDIVRLMASVTPTM